MRMMDATTDTPTGATESEERILPISAQGAMDCALDSHTHSTYRFQLSVRYPMNE
jgi:hypothetical protein